jgi:hypothetical protein
MPITITVMGNAPVKAWADMLEELQQESPKSQKETAPEENQEPELTEEEAQGLFRGCCESEEYTPEMYEVTVILKNGHESTYIPDVATMDSILGFLENGASMEFFPIDVDTEAGTRRYVRTNMILDVQLRAIND